MAGRAIWLPRSTAAPPLSQLGIDARTASIGDALDRGTTHLDERLSTMDRALTVGLDAVNRTIEGKAAGLAASLRSAVADTTQGMDGEAMRAAASLSQTGQQFAEGLDTRSDEFARTMDERSEQIVSRVSEAQNRLAGQAAAVAQTFSEAGNAIINKVAEAETLVSGQVGAISKALSDAQATFESHGTAIRTTISAPATEIARKSQQRHPHQPRPRLDTTLDRPGARSARQLDPLDARRSHPRAQLDARRPFLGTVAHPRRNGPPDDRPLCRDRQGSGARIIAAATQQSAERCAPENAARRPDRCDRRPHRARRLGRGRDGEQPVVQRQQPDRAPVGQQRCDGPDDEPRRRRSDQLSMAVSATRPRASPNPPSKAAEMVSASTRLLEGKVDRLSDISGQTLAQVGSIIGRFDEHSKVLARHQPARPLPSPTSSRRWKTANPRCRTSRSASSSAPKRSKRRCARSAAWSRPPSIAPSSAPTRSAATCARASSPPSPISATLSEAEKRADRSRRDDAQRVAKASEDANTTIDSTFANAERRSGDLANRLRGGLTASLSDVERMLGEAGRASDGAAQQLRESLREAVDEAVVALLRAPPRKFVALPAISARNST
jgi:hypothetical protein